MKNINMIRSKTLITIFVIFVVMISTVSGIAVNADDVGSVFCEIDSGTNITWRLSENGVLTVSGEGEMFNENSDIYGLLNEYRSSIVEIVVEENITSIGYSAFENWINLRKVTLPETLKKIQYAAFRNCSSLSEISLPQSIESIEGGCFEGCSSLGELVLPEKIKCINQETFLYCTNLKIDKLPDSIESIGWTAFYGCSEFELNNVPSSLKTIGGFAFGDCRKITKADLPESVTEIGEYAFCNTGLESIIIRGKPKKIEWYTFSCCDKLKKIDIPESVAEIGSGAFSASGLTDIVIPKSVKKISSGAFESCKSLESVTVYNTLETIEVNAFNWDSSLKTVNFIGTQNEWTIFNSDENIYEGNDCFRNAEVSFGSLCGEYIRSNFDENSGELEIIGHGDMFDYVSETELPWYPFRDKIKSVSFNGEITEISDYVFYGLNSLESICIPDSVIELGDYAFGNCEKLKSISVGNGVSAVNEKTFAECGKVQKITLGTSIESIDGSAFKDTVSLAEIIVSQGNSKFSSTGSFLIEGNDILLKRAPCYAAENCIIPDCIKIISENAFENCKNIRKITMPESVESVENNAFAGCNNLESVEYTGKRNEWFELTESQSFGSGNDIILSADIVYSGYSCGDDLAGIFDEKAKLLTVSGYGEMYNYSYETIPWADLRSCLENVEFDGNITKISDYLFADCVKLKEFKIPETVSAISAYMLMGCKIEEITIDDSISYIGEGAFENCTALEKINVGNNITYIGENAFLNTEFYNNAGNYDNKLLYLDFYNKYLITAVNNNIHQVFNGKTNSRTVLIASGAFRGVECESLILNDGLKYIGSAAFADSSILSVDFPKSVVSCAEDIFKNSSAQTVNYDSGRAEWLKLNIEFNGTVYYTLKTDDGRVKVIYCDDDLPEEAGNVEVCGAPDVTVEDIADPTHSQIRNSRFYNKDITHIFENMNISIGNRFGAVQPLAGRTVSLMIKASDDFSNMICQGILNKFPEVSSVKFSDVSIEKGIVKYQQGNKIFETDAVSFAAEKRFKIYHWYSEPFDDNFDGEDEIYFSYYLKDITLENGFIGLAVPHFSEFAMATDHSGFRQEEYNVLAGEKIKVSFVHNPGEVVSYSVSDPSVAEIDKDGIVFGKENGETVIYAYIDEICVAQCNVCVSKPELEIEGYRESRNIECRQTVTFFAAGILPDDASVFWYYNGDKVASGASYTVSKPTNDYTIQCRAFNGSGKLIAESKTETVYVKHGFFDLLISFFRNLFGLIPEIKQK